MLPISRVVSKSLDTDKLALVVRVEGIIHEVVIYVGLLADDGGVDGDGGLRSGLPAAHETVVDLVLPQGLNRCQICRQWLR